MRVSVPLCRFVTRQELDRLSMGHLVGTSLLRAYMHGFFVHNKLWQKANTIAAPVDYATVRKERIQSKMESERAQRITLKRKLPKVCDQAQPYFGHRICQLVFSTRPYVSVSIHAGKENQRKTGC